MIKAVGVIFVAEGRVLLLKRSDHGDAAGQWALPGGKIEEGEDLLQALERECLEEIGLYPKGGVAEPLTRSYNGDVDYITLTQGTTEFVPTLNEEHTEYVWAPFGQYPDPLHPGVAEALRKLTMTELDVADGIRDGLFPSPSQFKNVLLVAMRITGTGVAYRSEGKEFVFRDKSIYLNDEFLRRCNGLIVVSEHPERASLTHNEFVNRTVGSIFVPYIKGDEVWGIAKIYDEDMVDLLQTEQLSTSPTVVFRAHALNTKVALEDGSTLLIEGKPSLLDHLAICVQGVWDKGKPPSGVEVTSAGLQSIHGEVKMADEKKSETEAVKENNEESKKAILNEGETKEKKDAAKKDGEEDLATPSLNEKLDAMLAKLDSVNTRMDAFEEDKKKAADAVKRDSESEEDKKKRMDAEEEKKKEEEEDKKKKDAEKEKADRAKADDDTRKAIADLEAKMPKEMSDEEAAMMSDAQAKADSVYAAHGKSAPRPLNGETHLAFRKRLVSAFREHSKAWKSVDLGPLPAPVIDVAEAAIYADAMNAALNPVGLEAGQLRARVTVDGVGRRITTFHGDPSGWLDDHRIPPRRLDGINKSHKEHA